MLKEGNEKPVEWSYTPDVEASPKSKHKGIKQVLKLVAQVLKQKTVSIIFSLLSFPEITGLFQL